MDLIHGLSPLIHRVEPQVQQPLMISTECKRPPGYFEIPARPRHHPAPTWKPSTANLMRKYGPNLCLRISWHIKKSPSSFMLMATRRMNEESNIATSIMRRSFTHPQDRQLSVLAVAQAINARTGAKLRRCSGQIPCCLNACRCIAVP